MATTFEELKNIKQYEEIELPPFNDGTKFVAKLKKPSIINMVGDSGAVSNPLIEVIKKVIGEDNKKDINAESFDDVESKIESMRFMRTIAQNCLVSPTWNEIEETVGGLNDEQIIAIFNYAMNGAKQLSKFC